jgi:hypothetical protein
MTQEHPINPPPELIEQWVDILIQGSIKAFTTAAQWGADAELEACCEWLSVPCPSYGRELRNARRPKPPSLKEQALKEIEELAREAVTGCNLDILERAIKSIPD